MPHKWANRPREVGFATRRYRRAMSAAPAPALLDASPLAAAVGAETDHLTVAAYDDGVVLVTLAQPERRNAMSDRMSAAWPRLMAELRADPSVRVVVVTGAGRAFCSGGDHGWIGGDPDASVVQLRERMLRFYRGWLSLRSLEVPTIAAVNGAAVGAGAALALACDLRYAAASARFAVPFATLGLHPGMGTSWLLPEVVGMAAARDLLLTGRVVDAEEMLRLGLVSSVSGDDGFVEGVLHAAHAIAVAAPIATRLTKAGLAGGGHPGFDAALEWEALAQSVTLATDDLREGLAAAREKRPPRFTGR
jgi:enoyl-CoA hydratase